MQQAVPAQRAAMSAFALFFGILAAPAAWTLQVCVAETLVAQSCFPHFAPQRAAYAGIGLGAVVGVSALALIVGIAGACMAWRNWHAVRQLPQDAVPKAERGMLGGQAFLTRVGLMSNTLFVFALIATDVATALVAPCRP
jgi:hypothetical protein